MEAQDALQSSRKLQSSGRKYYKIISKQNNHKVFKRYTPKIINTT